MIQVLFVINQIKFQLAAECNLAEVKELQEQSQAQRFVVKAINKDDDDVGVGKSDKIEGDESEAESGMENMESSTEAGLDDENLKE